MHKEKIVELGNTGNAEKAVIMLHGRGSNAQDILTLSAHLNIDNYVLYAPQATNNTWYPYSFLEAPSENEPWLSSALDLVGTAVEKIINKGITKENIYFTGFSQGACLALEYVTRNAIKYGGVAAFTGGLIGDKIHPENYNGNFDDTPVFIGSSDPDPHIPLERIDDTVEILENMNANVTKKVYENMGHTINEDEINSANKLIFK